MMAYVQKNETVSEGAQYLFWGSLIYMAWRFLPPLTGAGTAPAQAATTSDTDMGPPDLLVQERAIWHVLKQFQATTNMFLAGKNLPAEGLHRARRKNAVPPTERILGLIDFTGDTDDCEDSLLFGCEGVYGWGLRLDKQTPLAIPYADFPNRTFVNHGVVVYLGKDEFLRPNLDNSPADCETITGLLKAIRSLSTSVKGTETGP
jgi:hypothetical protein